MAFVSGGKERKELLRSTERLVDGERMNSSTVQSCANTRHGPCWFAMTPD